MSLASVVLTGDPGGTALTESVVDMVPGDYRERVVDLTVPYDADVTYSVKADLVADATATPNDFSQAGDTLNNIDGTNTGLAATDLSDINAPAGQGGLLVEVYRCTGGGNVYESTAGVIASRTDDREVSCNNASVPQGAKGNGTGVAAVDPSGQSTFTQLDVADHYGCGRRPNGTIWCWGENSSGQFGDGSANRSLLPIIAAGSATTWTQVTTAGATSCGRRSDGTLWCWGRNGNGQVGDNSTSTRTTPVQTSGGYTDWTNVSNGEFNVCGVRANSTLWCWGANTSGQVGDATTTARLVPTIASGGFTDWTESSIGSQFACGRRANGTLYCWGDNTFGQLGDGTTFPRTSPTLVGGGFTDWVEVSANAYSACGRRSNGTIYCWGMNVASQVGDGTTTQRTSPTIVNGGFTDWTSLSGGYNHTCATRSNGTVYCWGANAFGQTGQSPSDAVSAPTLVSGAYMDWTAVSSGRTHTCGLRQSGRPWCWGANSSTQLGNNVSLTRTAPEQLGAATDWTQITNGRYHACGIRSGAAYCWGRNGNGQVGDDSTLDRSSPVLVSGGFTDWTQLSAGHTQTCGRRSNGTIYCWGENTDGQLGDNTRTQRLTPTIVNGGYTDWTAITAGSSHTCGRRSNSTVYCWGANSNGQLGDNTTVQKLIPTIVNGGFTDWTMVSSLATHTCGVRSNGTAYCWGNNGNGQLGDNTTVQKLIPTIVNGGYTDWTAISAGAAHTCGLRGTGFGWCWGRNSSGQLGDNTYVQKLIPTAVSGGLPDFSSLSAGDLHSCGRRTNSTIYCYGANANANLGDGTTTPQPVVTLVSGGITTFTQASVGYVTSCGLRSNGTVWCWGWNRYGMLGTPDATTAPTMTHLLTTGDYTTPVVVRPAGQSLRLLIRVRLTNDGTTDGRQNVLLGEQITLTHRFALVERTAGAA
jgi:alpha-tubulin suppressor-like RCC1 family protein